MRCPICKKEVDWEGSPYRPFCGERCQLLDLGNWASGEYVISEEDEDVAEGSGKTQIPEEDAKRDR